MESCKKIVSPSYYNNYYDHDNSYIFRNLTPCEGVVKDHVHEEMMEEVKAHWRDHYSINFNNYAVQDEYAPKEKVINGA